MTYRNTETSTSPQNTDTDVHPLLNPADIDKFDASDEDDFWEEVDSSD